MIHPQNRTDFKTKPKAKRDQIGPGQYELNYKTAEPKTREFNFSKLPGQNFIDHYVKQKKVVPPPNKYQLDKSYSCISKGVSSLSRKRF